MCITKAKKQYAAWIDRHEIHPIWLKITSDTEMQEKYNDQIRSQVYSILKICCACAWMFSIICVILNYGRSFEEQVAFLSFIVAGVEVVTIMTIAVKCKRSLADYSLVFMMTIRCSWTILVTYFVESGASGFGVLDLKEVPQFIPLMANPMILMLMCNLKFDAFVTIPMVLASIALVC